MSDHFLGVLGYHLDVEIQGLFILKINLCWLSIELIIEYFWDPVAIHGDNVVCSDIFLKKDVFISI